MGRFVEERRNQFDKREREREKGKETEGKGREGKERKKRKNIIYLYETTKICVTILSLEKKEEGWGR